MAHMRISFVTKSQLAPVPVGHPIHFGPHLLLSDKDFDAVWQLLKCRHCSFRRLYHRLAVSERKDSKRFDPHFHSLCRAIKAVLQGLCLNRQCSTQLVVTSSHTPVLPPDPAMTPDYMTVTRTSVSVQNRLAVCPSHGRQLFDLLYCQECDTGCSSTDDGQQSDVSSTSCRDRFFIPGGHSVFFRSLSAEEASSDDSDADDQNEEEHSNQFTTTSKPNTTVRILSVSGQGVLGAVQATIHNCYCDSVQLNAWNNDSASVHLACLHERVIEANRKWSAFYGDSPREKRIIPAVSVGPTKTGHHAHFPTNNPVTSVHHMLTYAVASSLERRDRTWETAAQHRIFTRYCRLMSSGHDPCTASELAERSSDEEDGDGDVHAYSTTTTTTTTTTATKSTDIITDTVVQLTDAAPKSTRKKRRKRRKRASRNRASPAPDAWGVKSSDYHPLSIFFSNPIPCQSGVPAPL